jgi:DNA-binding GntR family transcriptional regulator
VDTLSHEIFERLVDDIISGRLKPGARLDEPSICRKFGVSRTPIRETLRRLGGTGLVEIAPRKGVTVAQIDVARLNDMFEALAELEGLCAKLAAVRMTTLEKKRLEFSNASRKKRASEKKADLSSLNNEFHEAIYAGSHNESLGNVTRSFRQRLAPFRALQFTRGKTEYAFHEHDSIMDAILSSDAERAYNRMRDHITGAGLQVVEHFGRSEKIQRPRSRINQARRK